MQKISLDNENRKCYYVMISPVISIHLTIFFYFKTAKKYHGRLQNNEITLEVNVIFIYIQ